MNFIKILSKKKIQNLIEQDKIKKKLKGIFLVWQAKFKVVWLRGILNFLISKRYFKSLTFAFFGVVSLIRNFQSYLTIKMLLL